MRRRGLVRAGARVLRMPAPDRRRTLEAAAELTRASLELKLLPSKRTVSRLGEPRRGEEDHPRHDAGGLPEARRVGHAVAAVARRLPWHPTCLRQALAVQRMLRRRAIPCRLHLGVADPRAATAHAWVTVEGHTVVGDHEDETFVPLAAFA